MKIVCPYCDADNIEGADVCEQCQQPLDHLHLAAPATLVERGLLTDRVHRLHPKPPVVVTPSTPVGEVLKTLSEKQIGCVIVVDNQQVVGIFSERDALLRLNIDAPQHATQPVSDFMTPNPQCLQNDVKIAFAVQRMDLGGFRHVPVVDADGRPTGIVSVRDILRYFTDKLNVAGSV